MLSVITILKHKTNQAGAIIEGWTRSALNIRTNVMEYREENYCMKCPVAHKDGVYTGLCEKQKGGCGCGTREKSSQNSQGCPLGFWAGDWFKPEEFEKYLKENPIQ